VFILLPPSEGKTAPTGGPALDLTALSFPELTAPRTAVVGALVSLCTGSATTAQKILGISARMTAEMDRNATLLSQPCAPAVEIYTGVLYDALDWNTLSSAAKKRGNKHLAIASALFGLVRPQDFIPAYRLSGDTNLPPVGRLSTVWKESVSEAISRTAGKGIIVDLRSSAYVALGPVDADRAERTVVARVLQQKGSKRVIVSHHNKFTKGQMVRHLLDNPTPKNIPDAAGALGEAGLRVELAPPTKETAPWTLDIIL
jgi:cytoplasmic iron level regulating protein YaaA (DUF328/UPF0246 family)